MVVAHLQDRCYNPRTGKMAFEWFTGTKPNIIIFIFLVQFVIDRKEA